MNPLPNKLLLSFDQYEAMQMAHIKMIRDNTGHYPDLVRQNFERSQAFENLKNQLIPVLRNIKGKSKAETVIREYQDRFEEIKKQDDILFGFFLQYRNRLKQQKQEINHSKKALNGYGSLSSTGLPRFLSRPV